MAKHFSDHRRRDAQVPGSESRIEEFDILALPA